MCPEKVVYGSMWWWVMGSWEEGSCCCLQVLVRVQNSHSSSWRCMVMWQEAMGPGLKKANNAHILGKWKDSTNWHHEHLCDWRYSLSSVQSSCLMKLTQHWAQHVPLGLHYSVVFIQPSLYQVGCAGAASLQTHPDVSDFCLVVPVRIFNVPLGKDQAVKCGNLSGENSSVIATWRFKF